MDHRKLATVHNVIAVKANRQLKMPAGEAIVPIVEEGHKIRFHNTLAPDSESNDDIAYRHYLYKMHTYLR